MKLRYIYILSCCSCKAASIAACCCWYVAAVDTTVVALAGVSIVWYVVCAVIVGIYVGITDCVTLTSWLIAGGLMPCQTDQY